MMLHIFLEKSLLGWIECELEVMYDLAANGVIYLLIQNIDAMGVHIADLIIVASAKILTDKEYHRHRDYSTALINLWLECG